jgi:hypothetical protein
MTPSFPKSPWTRGFAAFAFASFLTAAGCDSTAPLTGQTGVAGTGGAAGAPSGAGGAAGAPAATGGPVNDPGAGGAPAGLQANGSIMYVRSK